MAGMRVETLGSGDAVGQCRGGTRRHDAVGPGRHDQCGQSQPFGSNHLVGYLPNASAWTVLAIPADEALAGNANSQGDAVIQPVFERNEEMGALRSGIKP